MEILSLTPDEALALLSQRAAALMGRPGRTVLGLAGGPGVGKSTLAKRLVAALGPVAAYVPMDGFHLPHARLDALGLVADKGMTHTFDGAGFAACLAALKAAREPVPVPAYSRRIEDVVADALTIPASARLLVTEGNYLLLDAAPWHQVRPLLDLAVYLEVPRALARARLLRRHAAEGLFTEARNLAHVARVDLANFDLVAASRPRADLAIALVTET